MPNIKSEAVKAKPPVPTSPEQAAGLLKLSRRSLEVGGCVRKDDTIGEGLRAIANGRFESLRSAVGYSALSDSILDELASLAPPAGRPLKTIGPGSPGRRQ